jgi:hypothetical protein
MECCMTTRRYASLCCFLALATSPAAMANTPDDMSRPFDRYTWVTTHNAFTSNGTFPNQSQTIAEQLNSGVRGLMLDLHFSNGRVRLCHNVCRSLGTQAFADLLNETILPFLDAHPDAILTLQLEDFTTLRQLATELEMAPGLAGTTFDPDSWDTRGWPTYQQMLDRGQRVLIFSLNETNTGAIPAGDGIVDIMATSEYTVENYWSLGATPLRHDFSCVSRWGEDVRPLARQAVTGKPGWRPLFTMNQFHGVPAQVHAGSDNSYEALTARYLDYCRPVAKRKPNFIAVDFHDVGDTAKVADWMTLTAPDGP